MNLCFSILTIRPVIRSPFLRTTTAACTEKGMVMRKVMRRKAGRKVLRKCRRINQCSLGERRTASRDFR